MIRQRNKFLTFCFSMLPGAGHMFMGMMKRGASFMLLFFGSLFLAGYMHFSALIAAAAILWFYSVFDAMNKDCLPEMVFAEVSDAWIWESAYVSGRKQSKWTATVLIVLGSITLLSTLLRGMKNILKTFELSNQFMSIINQMNDCFPGIVLSGLIIAIGVGLILGKKKALDQEMNTDALENQMELLEKSEDENRKEEQ